MDDAAFVNWFLVDRLRRCGDRGVFLALGWVFRVWIFLGERVRNQGLHT